jgi:hypothetical protein
MNWSLSLAIFHLSIEFDFSHFPNINNTGDKVQANLEIQGLPD